MKSSMHEDHAKISVVIPSYNAAGMIEQAVDSVLAQDWPNIECIVIDDGSTDDTEQVLAPYSEKIRYLRKQNGGFASARNLGMRESHGEFIAWLDADDIFQPDKLSRQMVLLTECPEIGLVCTDFSMFDKNGVIYDSALSQYYGVLKKILGFEDIFSRKHALGNGDVCWSGFVLDTLLKGNFIHPPTVLFRKQVFDQVGPQLEGLVNATDYEYLSRIAGQYQIGLLNEPLLQYRISEGQSSSSANFSKNAQYNEMALRHMLESFSLDTGQRKLTVEHLRKVRMLAARHLAEDEKFLALKYLFLAQVGGVPNLKSLIVLMKIMTPNWLIRWRRRNFINEDQHGF